MTPVVWTLVVIAMNGQGAYPHPQIGVIPEFRSEAACIAAGEKVIAAARSAANAKWGRLDITYSCTRNS